MKKTLVYIIIIAAVIILSFLSCYFILNLMNTESDTIEEYFVRYRVTISYKIVNDTTSDKASISYILYDKIKVINWAMLNISASYNSLKYDGNISYLENFINSLKNTSFMITTDNYFKAFIYGLRLFTPEIITRGSKSKLNIINSYFNYKYMGSTDFLDNFTFVGYIVYDDESFSFIHTNVSYYSALGIPFYFKQKSVHKHAVNGEKEITEYLEYTFSVIDTNLPTNIHKHLINADNVKLIISSIKDARFSIEADKGSNIITINNAGEDPMLLIIIGANIVDLEVNGEKRLVLPGPHPTLFIDTKLIPSKSTTKIYVNTYLNKSISLNTIKDTKKTSYNNVIIAVSIIIALGIVVLVAKRYLKKVY